MNLAQQLSTAKQSRKVSYNMGPFIEKDWSESLSCPPLTNWHQLAPGS